MNHNSQKKIAVINDFSGFGRCSIAVALPIISAMKIQCCPVPTAIFSNHTGFPSFYCSDFTAHMTSYINEWEKLGLHFDGICTGFLGSIEQIEIVRHFLKHFNSENTVVVIDPVMGDYGKLYPTYSPKLAKNMHRLIKYADILTPNLTEACILTDVPYCDDYDRKALTAMCKNLSVQGPKKIVISGIKMGEYIGNFVYEEGYKPRLIKTLKIGLNRSGTGDVFSSIVTSEAVLGRDFFSSVKKAADFISKAIALTIERGIPVTDGVCFEDFLGELV